MSSSRDPLLNRRQFIGQASCAGISMAPLLSTLLTLRLANSLAAQTASTDYKALVCLFLSGGNDSWNMLVPTTTGEYEAYAQIRRNLAHAKDSVLSITPGNMGGRTLGIHPSMTEVRDMFTQGRLAFVSNVGSLVRPMTLAEYKSGKNLPLSLYSHADQIKQWQTCIPDARTAIGWGGRAADILRGLNSQSLVSMNISLSGQSVFLTGRDAFTYSVSSSGATALTGYSPTAVNSLTAQRTKGFNSVMDQQYRNLFEQTYAQSTGDAVDSYYEFSNALTGVTLSTAVPTGNSLATSLSMIARIMASRAKFGAQRQIFFVQLGGWDHHDEVLNNQLTMLRTVSQAMGYFDSALTELGLSKNVTLFTASDFARTLTSNGNGSDHAWGGNHMVMGGAVNGGRVYGDAAAGFYPDLRTLSQIDTGQGRLIPGVAVDEYARDLLSWFGVSASNMDYVLPAFSSRFGGRPSLGLFSGTSSATAPAGSTGSGSTSSGSTSTAGSSSSSGGGGGGATTPYFLGALGALALARLRQKRLEKKRAEEAAADPAAK
jgi:uncharacterized protein (DUF1501 family)